MIGHNEITTTEHPMKLSPAQTFAIKLFKRKDNWLSMHQSLVQETTLSALRRRGLVTFDMDTARYDLTELGQALFPEYKIPTRPEQAQSPAPAVDVHAWTNASGLFSHNA